MSFTLTLYDFSTHAIRMDSHNVQGDCTFLKSILSFILHYTQIACIATTFPSFLEIFIIGLQ
jgi:hypothetical protein